MITKRGFLGLPVIFTLLSCSDNTQITEEILNNSTIKLYTNQNNIPVVISAQPIEGSMEFSLTGRKALRLPRLKC